MGPQINCAETETLSDMLHSWSVELSICMHACRAVNIASDCHMHADRSFYLSQLTQTKDPATSGTARSQNVQYCSLNCSEGLIDRTGANSMNSESSHSSIHPHHASFTNYNWQLLINSTRSHFSKGQKTMRESLWMQITTKILHISGQNRRVLGRGSEGTVRMTHLGNLATDMCGRIEDVY